MIILMLVRGKRFRLRSLTKREEPAKIDRKWRRCWIGTIGQISGLSKGNLAMRSKRGRIEDEELMDLIEERELHFNVTRAYVRVDFVWIPRG